MPFSEMVPLSTWRTAVHTASLVYLVPSCVRSDWFMIRTNTTSEAYKLRHGQVTARSGGSAVLDKGRGNGVLASVLVLDLEVVLKELQAACQYLANLESVAYNTHHHVTLALLKVHLLLKRGAQGVQGVTTRDDLGVGEESHCCFMLVSHLLPDLRSRSAVTYAT